MTTPPSLPTLAGLAWSRHKKPGFSTRVASHVSGREVRVALMAYPLYEFEAVYNGLASSATAAFAGLGSTSLQILMGFFLQLQGQFGTFLYSDPDDNAVTGQAIGVGDGSTQSFVMGRSLGGWNEPVGWVTDIVNVYCNGTAQSASSYVLTAPNSLDFYAAPAAGTAISADFSYAFQCRFLDDQMDFEEFKTSLWKLQSMKFRSVKVNSTPAPWYTPYEIGGTAPTLWADFRTEGAANRYLYNGTTYGSGATLLAALGATFSRSSTASYVNSSGLLATAATNALRFDYDPSTFAAKGILLEGASTNLLDQSNGFGSAPWGAQFGSIAQNATGPDGVASSAWTMTAEGANLCRTYQAISQAAPAAISFWAKAGTDSWAFIMGNDGTNLLATWFDLTNGVVGDQNVVIGGSAAFSLTNATIVPYGDGWYRISVVTSGATMEYIYLGFSDGNGSLTVTSGRTGLLYGAQLEALPFASSYIPTTTSTASRSADDLSAATWPAITAATLYARADTEYAGQTQRLLQIDDGTANNRASLSLDASAAAAFAFLNAGTSAAALLAGTIATGAPAQMAAAFQVNDFALVEGGGTPATASSGAVPSLSKLRLGADGAGANGLFGHIAQVGVWNNLRGPNAILQSLT